jgi:hypothetical protein
VIRCRQASAKSDFDSAASMRYLQVDRMMLI